MPRAIRPRALVDHRLWLLASVAAAVSYFFFRDNSVPGTVLIAWKGAGVGLLAIYAARRGTGVNGRLLVAVLTLGALADMLLELDLTSGGALFALAHLLAIVLFVRNPRARRTGSQVLAALALLLGAPLAAALITMPDARWPLAAGYALVVGAMAASAWVSGFPRYRVGIGAVLFVASDLFIFAREGQRVPEMVTWWLIWPLYYAGQLLIAIGVARTTRRKRP